MGYIRNDAVVAIVHPEYSEEKEKGPTEKAIDELRTRMGGEGADWKLDHLLVGPLMGVNYVHIYFFAPDGSKEGWGTSDKADEFRKEFIGIIKASRYPEMVHVQFGGDDQITRILESTDEAVARIT